MHANPMPKMLLLFQPFFSTPEGKTIVVVRAPDPLVSVGLATAPLVGVIVGFATVPLVVGAPVLVEALPKP